MSRSATMRCSRCDAICSIENPEQLLRTVVCAQCAAQPEVQQFVTNESTWHQQERVTAAAARRRFNARTKRLEKLEALRLTRLAERSIPASGAASALPAHLQAALNRARKPK